MIDPLTTEQVLKGYLIGGFYALMLWPLVREILLDDMKFFQREGETGLAFIGRAIVFYFLWPVYGVAVFVHFIRNHFIPWLTTPA